ncbi:MAG: sigma-70 family RNA polymerase sigma factor [Bacteroidetes bacterium]|nr:sigma-70 family RNA polymerase sigma factor [Bacteroidota bacterium]
MIKGILKGKKTEHPDGDNELAKAVVAGDEVAMDQLYRAYAPKILTLCRRYASGKEEALDLLHDGFLKAFEKMDSFHGHGDLGIWVKRVVLNQAINTLKRKVKWEELPEEWPEEEVWEEEAANPEELIALIQALPTGYRMVMNLYVFEKMSHDEIAAQLGISPVSSRTQLFKARRLLKKRWKQ